MALVTYLYSGVNYLGPQAAGASLSLVTSGGLTIPYLEKQHISVSVTASPNDQTPTFTALTRPGQWDFNAAGTAIVLVSALASGSAVRIKRTTPDATVYEVFNEGSLLTAEQLNLSEQWTLYLGQESAEVSGLANANSTAALTAATTASANASTALSTVNTANSNASTALATANTASANASTALSTANTAAGNASTALSTANTASSNASAAVSTANTASSNASTALSTANTASANASQALSDSANKWNKTTETLESTEAWLNSDLYLATAKAINARIVDLLNDIGSYVVVESETQFPNSGITDGLGAPDADVLISVTDATGLTWAGGSSTNATRANGSAVTITGITGTSPIANCGMQLLSTATLHTYTFVKWVVGSSVAQTISDNINEILQVDTNTATASAAAASATASATSATASQQAANDWAIKTNGAVAGGEYSSKYHAQLASASASSASNNALIVQNTANTLQTLGAFLNWGLITEAAGTTTDYGALT